MASGPALFRVVAIVSAIFGIGLVAVSGALLNQAIGYREYYFYGAGYGGSGYGGAGYGGAGYGGAGYGGAGYGTGTAYGRGQYGYGGAGGYQEDYVGYDPYRYHRVIAVTAVAVGAGIFQFMIALLLCCVDGKNSKPLAVGYIVGYILILITLLACFGLAFQYRVIYPYYFYNSYNAAYSYYQQYNPSGQAFCAILGIDVIYILVSLIVVGIFAKREIGYGDADEWHVRPTGTPSTAPPNEYGRDGIRIA